MPGGGWSPASTSGAAGIFGACRTEGTAGGGVSAYRGRDPERERGLSGSLGPQHSSPGAERAAPSCGRGWGVRVRDVCAGPTGRGQGCGEERVRVRALRRVTCACTLLVRWAYGEQGGCGGRGGTSAPGRWSEINGFPGPDSRQEAWFSHLQNADIENACRIVFF